jgi:hypothetical protein
MNLNRHTTPSSPKRARTSNERLLPTSYPKKLGLTPPLLSSLSSDCAYSRYLQNIKQLPSKLIEGGAAFDLNTDYFHEYKNAWGIKDLRGRKSGSYFKTDGAINDIDLKDGKIGSSTNLVTRFSKYEKEGWSGEGVVINQRYKYDEEEIKIIENTIFSSLADVDESFEGGFQKWFETATIDKCRDWEKKEGLSIFLVIWLDMLKNKNGLNKLGVGNNLQVRNMEMGNQLHYGVEKGAVFEQLHYDVWDYIINNHDAVGKSTSSLMQKMRDKLEVDDTEKLEYKVHPSSVTWEPGLLKHNSAQALSRKFEQAFENEDIGTMNAEDMENHLVEITKVSEDEDEDLWYLLDGIETRKLNAAKDVWELGQLAMDQDDHDRELKLFRSVTEMCYDKLHNVQDSYGKKLWRNPYGDMPDIEDPYNTTNLNHKAARKDHEETIEDLKKTVKEYEEDGVLVHVACMVSPQSSLFPCNTFIPTLSLTPSFSLLFATGSNDDSI